jgi:hypothetical protein
VNKHSRQRWKEKRGVTLALALNAHWDDDFGEAKYVWDSMAANTSIKQRTQDAQIENEKDNKYDNEEGIRVSVQPRKCNARRTNNDVRWEYGRRDKDVWGNYRTSLNSTSHLPFSSPSSSPASSASHSSVLLLKKAEDVEGEAGSEDVGIDLIASLIFLFPFSFDCA